MKKPIPVVVPLLLISVSLAGCVFGGGGGNTSSSSSSAAVSSVAADQNADVIVSQPQPNTVVQSPLTVSGQAKGTWYFEASFPVKLLDGQGNVLAQAPAHALGDWMTTNLVPFAVTLTFTQPATPTGTLVLEKDNPSGLPQNAASISIPVKF